MAEAPAGGGGTWASTVLTGLGIAPNATNIAALHMWAASEGNSKGRGYNWLNSVLPEAGSSPLAGNSAGVQNYSSYAQGVAATTATLKGSVWSGVVRALGTPAGTIPNPTSAKKKTPVNRSALSRIWTAIHQASKSWTTTQPNYPAVMWTFLNGKGATSGGTWAGTGTQNPTANAPEKSCVITVPNPFPFTSGGWCILDKSQLKAMKGALAIFVGVGVGVTGFLILAASGFGSSKAASGLKKVGGVLPGPIGTAVKSASPAARQARRTAATTRTTQETTARARLVTAQTREATARARQATRDAATRTERETETARPGSSRSPRGAAARRHIGSTEPRSRPRRIPANRTIRV